MSLAQFLCQFSDEINSAIFCDKLMKQSKQPTIQILVIN